MIGNLDTQVNPTLEIIVCYDYFDEPFESWITQNPKTLFGKDEGALNWRWKEEIGYAFSHFDRLNILLPISLLLNIPICI